MDYTIKESKLEKSIDKYLEANGFMIRYKFWSAIGYTICCQFFLLKNGNYSGRGTGYDIYFRLLNEDVTEYSQITESDLEYNDERSGKGYVKLDEFKIFPPEVVKKYFSNKVKNFLITRQFKKM